ncbi:hypothetical protein ACFQX6_46805 [Streptosporangium lutulentum]
MSGSPGGAVEAAFGPSDEEAAGLILLDLPDHDSIELSHRLEVDRLVELVDLLVWVLDPQKYADAVVHERYLRPLARHRDVMVVVLNQIDRLSPAAVERCLKDLRRLLDDDGLTGVPVVGISTRTGAGVSELRALLRSRVADRRSWATRLGADVGTAADALVRASSGADSHPADSSRGTDAEPSGSGTGRVSRSGRERGPGSGEEVPSASVPEVSVDGLARPLTDALSEAAGVQVVVEAVAKAHRHRSVAATGWPLTRWIRCSAPTRSAVSTWEPPRTGAPTSRSDEPRPPPRPSSSAPGWTPRSGRPPGPPRRNCPDRGRWPYGRRRARTETSWRTAWTGPWPPPRSGCPGGPCGGGWSDWRSGWCSRP